jgi:hypothetical protein
MCAWKVPKCPWFWAEVAVKAWRDLATQLRLSARQYLEIILFGILRNKIFQNSSALKSISLRMRRAGSGVAAAALTVGGWSLRRS